MDIWNIFLYKEKVDLNLDFEILKKTLFMFWLEKIRDRETILGTSEVNIEPLKTRLMVSKRTWDNTYSRTTQQVFGMAAMPFLCRGCWCVLLFHYPKIPKLGHMV